MIVFVLSVCYNKMQGTIICRIGRIENGLLTVAVMSILPLFGVPAPKVSMNIPYAKDSVFQMMDVAFPEQAGEEVSAVMVIHGGGWISGTRLSHTAQCEDYARQGFAAAAMDHRISPGRANYPDMLDDIGYALEELRRQAGERGLSIKNVALTGWSSGGHLALLYAFARHESAPIDIAFCAGFAPPSYFLDPGWWGHGNDLFTAVTLSLMLGVPVTAKTIASKYADIAAGASPYTHLDADCPPVIACFGRLDPLVPYSNALLMREKLAQLNTQGYEYEFLPFENSGHNLENDPETWARYNALFKQFVEKYM